MTARLATVLLTTSSLLCCATPQTLIISGTPNGRGPRGLHNGTFWLEHISYQEAVGFMIDSSRHHVGNDRAERGGASGWRADHHATLKP